MSSAQKTIHAINIDVANHLLYVANLMKQCNEIHYKIKPFIGNAKTIKDLEYPVNQVSDSYLLSLKGLGPAVLREIREFTKDGAQTTKVQKYFKLRDPAYRPYQEIHDISSTLESVLNEEFKSKYRVQVCGSLRRKAPFCRDIDIITTAPASEVYRIFEECEFEVKYGADKRIRFEAFGVGVDVRCISEQKFFFMLLHYTGSATHNIMLRNKAIAKGWTLSENGIFCKRTNQDILPHPTSEEQIFAKLGAKYAAPEER